MMSLSNITSSTMTSTSMTSHPLGGTEYLHRHPYSAIPFLILTSLACLAGMYIRCDFTYSNPRHTGTCYDNIYVICSGIYHYQYTGNIFTKYDLTVFLEQVFSVLYSYSCTCNMLNFKTAL